MTETAIAKRLDMGALIQQAVEHGAGVETMERLLAMAKEVRAEQSRAAWHQAMAAFQAEAPSVFKTSTGGSDGSFSYRYAKLGDIVSVVRPVLAKHGLSAVFQTVAKEGAIGARCIIAHSDGHTEVCELTVPIGGGGRMNAQQQVGSATTYAMRYAYCAALGIAPEDDDDDAQGAAPPSASGVRTTAQTSHPPLWRGKLVDHEVKNGGPTSKPWTLYKFKGADGTQFGTFSKSVCDGLLHLDGHFVEIETEKTAQGNLNIVSYRDVNEEEVPL